MALAATSWPSEIACLAPGVPELNARRTCSASLAGTVVPAGTVEFVSVARVVVVSDTHLSMRAPEADANWDAVVRHVAYTKPDLVVHLGDLTLDGAYDLDDLRHGRAQLDRLDAPWRAVPGNHDIGDNPWPGSPADDTVDAARLQRWVDVVGPDHWLVELDGWRLVAYNAQLAGSGLDAEVVQWDWLDGALGNTGPSTSTALIGHKPMAAPAAEIAAAPPHRYLPQEARERLMYRTRDVRIALALSGHVHQYRSLDHDGVTHVWAPTTWAVLPDALQPTLGAKRCGVLDVELHASGVAQHALVEPAGLAQLTLNHDIPSPYSH